MKFKSIDEIEKTIKPTADEMDIEIVEIEAKITKNPYITVYIDVDGGVDLDTCEKFHNAIDPLLDKLDPSFGAPYTLNVSSPGLDRPLKTDSDFNKRIGKDVEIKLYAPIMGRKFIEAKLIGYDGKNIVIEEDGKETVLPLSRIVKINEAIKFD